MPEPTQEFSRYWRIPAFEDDLRENIALLRATLAGAQKDLPQAQETARILTDQIKNFDKNYDKDEIPSEVPLLSAENIMLRVQLLQLLAYFEGINAINEHMQFPIHGFTITPTAIRHALEQ